MTGRQLFGVVVAVVALAQAVAQWLVADRPGRWRRYPFLPSDNATFRRAYAIFYAVLGVAILLMMLLLSGRDP